MHISTRTSIAAVPLLFAALVASSPARSEAASDDASPAPLPSERPSRQAPLPSDLRAYVRALVKRQLDPDTHGAAYRYRLERETKKGIVEYRDCVESDKILVTRLLAVNGNSLTDPQRQDDDARLNRIATTREAQDESLREQKEEAGRIRKIMEALPDAFLFSDGGRQVGADGVERQRIDFRSDPDFRPPSREAMALQGMAGSLWVNLNQQRLYKVEGELVRSVSFGWGFLGKLKRGGKFMVEYAPMASGRWMLTAMNIDFRASLFMGLSSAHLLERRVYTKFQQTRAGISAADAVKLLTAEPPPNLSASSDRRR